MNDEIPLIEKAKDGDERAFRQIYERHVDPLFRFMRQYSKDTVQVEEWVQRAFIKAYRNIHTFNATARFSTWLFTIALNEMRTDFRRPTLVVVTGDEPWRGSVPVDESLIWDAM